MTTEQAPDEEVLADLYYLGKYVADLKAKVKAGMLTKADAKTATQMHELAGKVHGQVNLRTGPW